MLKKLKVSTDKFFLERARTRKEVTTVEDLKPNDVLSLTPIIVAFKDIAPRFESPLCVARSRHYKLLHVGPCDKNGVSFITTCSKKGAPTCTRVCVLLRGGAVH